MIVSDSQVKRILTDLTYMEAATMEVLEIIGEQRDYFRDRIEEERHDVQP